MTDGKSYTPAFYQTIVALLHKYTSRIPSATPWEKGGKRTVPDISLYDHLRTTAAIAACIGRELSETEVDEELKLLITKKESDRNICALIKGDISGIQNFLYHILSDGASNQLRGRSFLPATANRGNRTLGFKTVRFAHHKSTACQWWTLFHHCTLYRIQREIKHDPPNNI